MPIDYTKWDKLELSDDSDIECHPNVDKRSMIRWKQQAIHQERAERKAKIEYLEKFLPNQQSLLEKITTLLDLLKQEDGVGKVLEELKRLRSVAKEQELDQTPVEGKGEQQPKNLEGVFTLMIEQLEAGLSSPDKVKEVLSERLESTRQSITKTISQASEDLKKLKAEESKKITSENMFHETSNRTVVNKSEIAPPPPAPAARKKTRKTEKVIETLNPGVQMKDLTPPSNESEDEADDEAEEGITMSSESLEFSKLKGFEASYNFIGKHPYIVSSTYSDPILGEAFTAQLKGNEAYAKNCVIQALTLQYCEKLGKDGVSLFFARMNGPNPQARQLFFDDVEKTYAHIKNRCKIIASEEKEKETIQLQMAEGTNPTIWIPDPNNKEDEEAAKVFAALPKAFQEALKIGTLEAINKALDKLKVEHAEEVIQVCSNYGFLDVGSNVEDQTKGNVE